MSLSEKVYDIMTGPIQNLAVSYYGFQLYRREYGPKFRRKLEEFEKMQWYSPDELQEYQEKMLGQLIRRCYNDVLYYMRVMDEHIYCKMNIKRSLGVT